MRIEHCYQLLEYIEDPVFLLQKTTIIWQNKSSMEYFSEAIGLDCFDFFVFDKPDELVEGLNTGRNVKFESRVFTQKKGGWLYFQVVYVAEPEILIFKDISEKRRLNEAKLNLSTMLVHEVKNPLGVLKTVLAELIEEEDSPEKIEKLWIADKQIHRLERIVQQIEYITMAQLGLYKPKNEIIDVMELVEDVLEDLQHLIVEKKIEVIEKIDIQKLEADRFILRTILRNVLSNALKYSLPNSKVLLEINERELIVKDFGIGIPENDLERVFERFYRTPMAVKMASGSGLGLPVVKYLANLAGYEIELSSKYMIGTTFKLKFRS